MISKKKITNDLPRATRDIDEIIPVLRGLIQVRGYLYADPEREREFKEKHPEFYGEEAL